MPTGGIRPLCSIANCGLPHYAKGYCRRHWTQWRAHGDPLANKDPQKKPCCVDGCSKTSVGRGLCHTHYQRQKKHGSPELGAFKPKGKCTVPGCNKPHLSRGWCGMHYARWQKRGDPAFEYVHERELLKFIEEKALPYRGDDCLIWPFGKTAAGYGAVVIDGRQRGVHVVVCGRTHGAKPGAEFEVAHGCGNRACCNPKHLRWATRSDNHADKVQHGTAQRGEKHPRAKITEADVREIRSLKGKLSQVEIAKRYGISSGTVGSIMQRRIWTLVE